MMDTRVFTVIETDEGNKAGYHFEWYGGRTVNIVSSNLEDMQVDTFNFMEQPDLDQVIKACEAYYQ